MAIKQIEQITVGGIEIPILSFDLDVGLQEKPSEITITFIDENGEYENPTLTTLSANTIQMGEDYQFDFFPIEYERSDSTSGGKLLKVKFVDGSFILDKLFIGLKNKHGQATELPVIIVGKEIDPCQTLEDGIIAENERDDPCNPCRENNNDSSPLQERTIDCVKERILNILEVDYNFQDLLDAIAPFVEIENPPEPNLFHRQKFTGNLRSVLQNWGSEMGFTFLWTEEGTLKFVDVRTEIPINNEGFEENNDVISRNITESLQNTVARGPIGYFKKNGALRDYSCDATWCKQMNMQPIQLDDVFENAGWYETFARMQFLIAMSIYSPYLRDNYVWYIWHDIKDIEKAKEKEGVLLEALALKIKRVLDPADEVDAQVITLIRESVADEGVKEDWAQRQAYFFAVEYDKDVHTQRYEWEASMGKDFVGKFFYRMFTEHFSGTQYSYLAPDGDSVNYYRSFSGTDDDSPKPHVASILPFFSLLRGDVSKVDDWLENLVDPNTGQPTNNFLLLEKNNIWWPMEDENPELTTLLEKSEDIHFQELGTIAGIENFIKLDPEEGEQWMVAFPLLEDFDIFQAIRDHPYEKENVRIPTDACDFVAYIGLQDASMRAYNIQLGETSVFFATPAQGYLKAGTYEGYDIVWEKGGNRTTDILQPKIELTRNAVPAYETDVMSIQVNTQDLTEDILEIFSDDQENLCAPLEDSILSKMATAMQGLDYTVDQPYRKEVYTIKGLPDKKYEIYDGVESVSIRLGNDGLETHITFANIKRKPIPYDIFVQKYLSYHTNLRSKFYANLRNNTRPDELERV